METLSSPVDIERVHSRLLNLGLLLNVLAPGSLLFVGALLKTRGVAGSSVGNLEFFFWVLIAVALGEIPAIYIIKRSFLSGKFLLRGREHVTAEQTLLQWGVISFSLALAPAIYGLVYYLLGGTLERFVLFVAITLFCFLVFKPKLEEIRSFVKKRSNFIDNTKEF
ncbi:MAG: hypothetical protein AMJ91_06255 [candidate division Zixibacteria bacterium SM23_73_3]|nr:MAG: hypothetical protein AMJ91_06255 [candidate division Zixibacteria bacterium SM23_73_3]